MATKRKNSTRTGWDSVVERLSANPASASPTTNVGEGHTRAVAIRKQGAGGRLVSRLEDEFLMQLRAHKIVGYTMEYRFHSTRRWRFDFAWILKGVAVEIEGGTWSGGRHTRGDGYEKDCEKYNEAVLMGWKVLRFTSSMIKNGMAIDMTREILNGTS
jgi:very-short-patch-repair endonuclease